MLNYNDFLLLEKRNRYKEAKTSLHLSRKISDKMKDIISLYIVSGTKVENGHARPLKKPRGLGIKMKGVSLGADKNGFYVYTHRARCKSYSSPETISDKDIKFIESTG